MTASGLSAHLHAVARMLDLIRRFDAEGGWRWMDRKAEVDDAAAQNKRRALHAYRADDGTVLVRGRPAPEVGALLTNWRG